MPSLKIAEKIKSTIPTHFYEIKSSQDCLERFFSFFHFFHFIYRLHEKHPWYSEQLTFLLVNTDNNKYLTKDELLEATKISEDFSVLSFSSDKLENWVDALIGIGDKNGDKRITFDEYVHMSHDAFVNNIAPRTLKRVLRQ